MTEGNRDLKSELRLRPGVAPSPLQSHAVTAPPAHCRDGTSMPARRLCETAHRYSNPHDNPAGLVLSTRICGEPYPQIVSPRTRKDPRLTGPGCEHFRATRHRELAGDRPRVRQALRALSSALSDTFLYTTTAIAAVALHVPCRPPDGHERRESHSGLARFFSAS